jgi:hypothetical protein
MNTSLRGNVSKTAGSWAKLVARISTGFPAIHWERSDRLVVAAVEDDEDARRLRADVFERMAEALEDVADVALAERFLPPSPVRTEQGHAERAAQHRLPLRGVGVPVQFAEHPSP